MSEVTMLKHGYSLVTSESSDVDEKEYSRSRLWYSSVNRWKTICIVVVTLLVTSLSANTILLYQQVFQPRKLCYDTPTQFDIVPEQEYASLNRTIQDAAWDKPNMLTWSLFLALDEQYTLSKGLPHSQRWPWDSNKGVYIPVATHELHCVQVIRSYVNDMEDGVKPAQMEWKYGHTTHCLNILRESIMCNANDYPMYTGWLHDNVGTDHPLPGRGSIKMCRNWDKFVTWAHSKSACYSPIDRNNPDYPEIERYKYCPDKSQPWENRQ